jgi:hypothetical protein
MRYSRVSGPRNARDPAVVAGSHLPLCRVRAPHRGTTGAGEATKILAVVTAITSCRAAPPLMYFQPWKGGANHVMQQHSDDVQDRPTGLGVIGLSAISSAVGQTTTEQAKQLTNRDKAPISEIDFRLSLSGANRASLLEHARGPPTIAAELTYKEFARESEMWRRASCWESLSTCRP